MDKNVELEYKFAADHVDPVKFDQAMRLLIPDESICVNVRDTYYVDPDGATCRHRVVDGSYQELTTKERKRLDSLRERVEVNVKIDAETHEDDVRTFMYMLGYDCELVLDKPDCAIYVFNNGEGEVEVALYTVVKEGSKDPKTFVEVEVSGDMSQDDATEVLDEWKDFLTETFKLGEPLNESLYEMYAPIHDLQPIHEES